MKNQRKKASKTTSMYGVIHRLICLRQLARMATGVVALGVVVALYALTPQTTAAHPARTGATVTLSFTVTIVAGTPASDALFWVCPDAKTDGTGCNEMTTQPDGAFTYQLSATTGTTYHHLIIEWSHGRLPGSSGPLPAPPAQIVCDVGPYTVTGSKSIPCQADLTPLTPTPPPSPTPGASPTPAATTDPIGTPGGSDNGTLITGLQIIIGVGLVLFFILLGILIWQRTSARRR